MIDAGLVFNGIQIAAAVDDGTFRARWHVPLDLPYFDGHFPGLPIFPAVGIVDATLHALRAHLKSPSLQLTGIPSAKFLSPVVPDARVVLHFRPTGTAVWDCDWKDDKHDKLLVSLRLSTA